MYKWKYLFLPKDTPGYNKKVEQIAMATKLTISINAKFNQEQIYNLCLEKSNNEFK